MASIKGTLGNDDLIGTPETDFIFGDSGDDILNGLGSADEFVFNNIFGVLYLDEVYVYSSDGFDTIKNFSSGKITNIDPVNHNSNHVSINYDAGSIIGLGANILTEEFSYDGNTGALYFQGTKFATLEKKPNFIRSLDIDLVNINNVATVEKKPNFIRSLDIDLVNTNNVATVEKTNNAASIIRLGVTSTKELSYNRNTSALSLHETQFATFENKSSLIPSLDIELRV